MKQTWIISWLVAVMFITGFGSAALGQGQNNKKLLQSLEQGDDDSLDEILDQGEEVLPSLLELARHSSAQVRAKALDLLTRIDLKDNGLLDREETVQAMNAAIDGSETSPEVVNEALSSLDKINPEKVSPVLLDNLLYQLNNGRAQAARVLGRVGEHSLIPTLEPYLTSRNKAVAESTRLALARLGDRQSLLAIVTELNIEGATRFKSFEKLAYINNPSTVRDIAQFLYDSGSPPSEIGPRDRVIYLPYSYMAAWALGQIVDDPPVIKSDVALLSKEDIKIWQSWWEAHQHEYP